MFNLNQSQKTSKDFSLSLPGVRQSAIKLIENPLTLEEVNVIVFILYNYKKIPFTWDSRNKLLEVNSIYLNKILTIGFR